VNGMRRLSLIVLCLAMTACGNEDVGESGQCTGGVIWNDTSYVGAALPPPHPAAGASLGSGREPGCNDGGGPEKDDSVNLRRVGDIPPEVAVYVDGENGAVYTNPGAFIELPAHPLHDNYFGGPRRPRRPARGDRCQVDGQALLVPSLAVRTANGQRNVVVDARTRIEGFDHAGMPILATGDFVRIHGRCRRGAIGARLIEPRP
jgi:hypothetical protein